MQKLFRVNSQLIINSRDIEAITVEPEGDQFCIIVYYFNQRTGAVDFAHYSKRTGKYTFEQNYAQKLFYDLSKELEA